MSDTIDRRSYLERIAVTSLAGGTVGLAGCSGGGDGDSSTDNSGAGSDGESSDASSTETSIEDQFPIEGEFNIAVGVVPNEGQYNPYNPKRLLIGPNNTPNQVLYDELWQPLPKTGEDYMGQGTLLSNRSYDPDNRLVTLDIREGSQWHNGDDYTARDLVTNYKMEQHVNAALQNVESFDIVDDKTVEITLEEAVNTQILWNSLLIEGTVKHSIFGEWLQRLEDAESDSETDQVLADLQNFSLDEPIGNGPFKFEEATSSQLRLSHFEDYHRTVPFTDYVYEYLPELNSIVSAFLGGELDGQAHMAAPTETQNQLPDAITKIESGTASGGWNLSVDMQHDFLGDRKVRQAIAHLIDRNRMAENTLPAHSYVENMVGLTNKMAPNWLGESLNEFETYEGNNTEHALELLEEAGYAQEDGQIVDGDGEQVSFEILAPTWENPNNVAETAQLTLEDFGMSVELSSQPGTQFSNRRSDGDFDMSLFYWWAPHPHDGYRADFIDRMDQINNDTEVTVPSFGESSGSMTVDVEERLNELYTTTDEETAREIVREIAWVYNNYLPTLPMTQGVSTSYINTESWNSVAEDSEHYDAFYPTEWWVRVGELYPNN